MAEKLSTEKFEMPGFGSKSPLGKEGFTHPLKDNGPVKPKSIVAAEEKEPKEESYEVPVVIRGEEVSDTRRIEYGYEDPIKIQKLQQEGVTPDSQKFGKK